MKKIIASALCLLMLLSLFACAAPTPEPGQETLAVPVDRALAWMNDKIENNKLMSFKYGDAEYADFIGNWEKTVEKGENTWKVTYTSPEKVVVWSEITFDPEFASFEWCNYFRNDGASDSPVISEIRAMDGEFEIENAKLTSANGSDARADDFEPFTVDFKEMPDYTLASSGGRSSNGAFPYFDLSNGSLGILAAVGWTGNWSAVFRYENGKVNVDAGMKETMISLHAAEDMRTPAIALMFFNGDQDNGHNQWRKLVMKTYTQKDSSGKPITTLPLTINEWGGLGEEHLLGVIDMLDRTNQAYDMIWVDAGWYGDVASPDTHDPAWSQQVGNWYYNKDIYPSNGFANVSARLHEKGKQLMVWFEPERARTGTWIVDNYPEYFFPNTMNEDRWMFNFARDDARDFMINLISGIIKESGIDWYREDFNMPASEKWLLGDSRYEGDNRTGITEIKYITNLYYYIDALKEQNPGLMMDNCSAGGRRLDFEMMKRSSPLWRTDYTVDGDYKNADCDGVRSIGYNLSWWIPMSCGGNAADGNGTDYQWRCQTSVGLTIGTDFRDRDWLATMKEQYYKIKDYMIGDYFMLAFGTEEEYNSSVAVYEFYRQDLKEGCILAFRPEACKTDEGVYSLKGLDANASYQLTVVDTGESATYTGAELMESGLGIKLPNPATSWLIWIKQVEGAAQAE